MLHVRCSSFAVPEHALVVHDSRVDDSSHPRAAAKHPRRKAAGEGLRRQRADAQIDFWHELADEPVTTNDDAFHGLLLYVDGKDDSADYAGRVATA